MSFFGKNIRKIRMARKLNQSDFALIFGLNRGNISAYEEGRSEAKVDTIVAIANYFGITIDQLLTRELTLDEIYKMDKARLKYAEVNRRATARGQVYVDSAHIAGYAAGCGSREFVEKLGRVHIPFLPEHYRAFELTNDLVVELKGAFLTGDIVFCQPQRVARIHTGRWYVLVARDALYAGRWQVVEGRSVESQDADCVSPCAFMFEEVKECWEIKGVFSLNFLHSLVIETRISNLERELERLRLEDGQGR